MGNGKGHHELRCLGNYDPKVAEELWSGVDAARATTCFPTVMPTFKRRNHEYLDGGLLANNPILEALREVTKLWPGREIDCIHSVGLHVTKAAASDIHSFGLDRTFSGPISQLAPVIESIGDTSQAHRH